jgi:hypothetical protein
MTSGLLERRSTTTITGGASTPSRTADQNCIEACVIQGESQHQVHGDDAVKLSRAMLLMPVIIWGDPTHTAEIGYFVRDREQRASAPQHPSGIMAPNHAGQHLARYPCRVARTLSVPRSSPEMKTVWAFCGVAERGTRNRVCRDSGGVVVGSARDQAWPKPAEELANPKRSNSMSLGFFRSSPYCDDPRCDARDSALAQEQTPAA